MQPKWFTLLIAVFVLCYVIDLIRKQKMTFKYSLTWLSTSLAVVVLAANDGILQTISRWAGFTLPSNFIFFVLLVFFVFLSLLLTIYINEQNSRTENLAQAIGLLEYKIKKLEKQTSPQDQST